MSMPWLTVCIPTIGRAGLVRTLESIRRQAGPLQVEIIVAADTYNGTFTKWLPTAMEHCRAYSARYIAVDGGMHCVGQPQRQAAMMKARGTWLMFSQDDNIVADGAIAQVRSQCELGPAPKLFRADTTNGGGVVWRAPELVAGNVDADGIVVLSNPSRLGRWTLGYSGDFDFLEQTVRLHGGALDFREFVVAWKQVDHG